MKVDSLVGWVEWGGVVSCRTRKASLLISQYFVHIITLITDSYNLSKLLETL